MKNHAELISVIVPVYRVEEYLDACVSSIVNQTYSKLEILLVDDGSPDRCGAMCDAWAAKDPRIKVLHKENGGLSDARNAGIDVAKGDYIFFVDSDDYIDSECITSLYALLTEESADIAAISFRSDDEPQNDPEERLAGSSDDMLVEIFQRCAWSAWGKLYKKELFKELRFIKGMLYEDFYLVPRLFGEANRAAYSDRKKYFYRIRENSIMTSGNTNPVLLDIAEKNLSFFLHHGYTKDQINRLFYCTKQELNGKYDPKNKKNLAYNEAFREFERKHFFRCLRTRSLYVFSVMGKLLHR